MKHLAALLAVALVGAAPHAALAQAPTTSGGGWDPAAPTAAAPAAAPAAAYPAQPTAYPPQQPAAYPPSGGYTAPPLPPPALEPRRGSWYIGFGLGGGSGSVRDAIGTRAFTEFVGSSPTTVSLGFRAGATLSPKLLLGFDLLALRTASTDQGIQVTSYGAVATFFPMEQGFFVKGGPTVTVLSLDDGSASSASWRGFGLNYGIGYAFWLGRSFNLSVALDGNTAWYGSDGPDSTSIGSLSVGFDWF